MTRTIAAFAAAVVVSATASIASAASIPATQSPAQLGNDVIRVHGNHRSCERGPGGWHRHNRFGERRPCRQWDGRGRRPDACVKFGPIWYCDY